MKLKTETGEMLVLDEAKEFYISENADSDTSIEVSKVEALLESGELEMVAEESDEVVEATEPKATKLKKKKITAVGAEDEVFEDEDEDGDDEDEDDEVEEDKKVAKEEVELEVDVKEDMDALFDGQELTEDFKKRTTLVFETAVKAKVKENLALIEDKMEAELTAKTDSLLEDITTKLDGYLDYMVTEWVEDNKLAVENGLKNEILEGFVGGLQTLFAENYIEIPEEKHNILDEQATQIAGLKEDLDAEMNKNIEARKALDEATAKEIFVQVSEDLTMTQVEKLNSLAEGVVFEDTESYTEKLETLKETYFPSEAKKEEVIAEAVDAKVSDSEEEMSASMQAIVNSLSKSTDTSIFGA
jgi:hypothetical protein